MKNKTIILVAFSLFLLSLSIGLNAQVPTWQKDLGEPIKSYEFMQDGKFLFFTSAEYVWCYNSESGENIWEMEIEDFEEEGISYLLGELFLTNSDNKLQAYDALSGKLLWENEYQGIDQGDYSSFEIILNYGFFQFGEDHLGIDLNNGKELFRLEIDYWGDLVNLGTFNYSVLDKEKKMLVMEDSEIATLIDIQTGERTFSEENFDVNTDLIENKLPWLYKTPDRDYLVFVLENGAVALDVANSKVIGRAEFDIDGDLNAILPTEVGCAVMGEEKFVHFNFETGSTIQLDYPLDDLRTMKSYTIEGKNILVLSLEDKISVIDLSGGKVLWETPANDETYEGYIHKYLPLDGSNLVFVQNRARLVSEEAGTYLYLMSMNGLTGKLNYKTPALLSGSAMNNFTRGLAKGITTAFASFIAVGSLGNERGAAGQAIDMVSEMMGYQNIGFEYETIERGDDIIFWERTPAVMMDPETREEPGEGIVSINGKTGKIKYKTYTEIATGMWVNESPHLAPPLFADDKLFISGDENLSAFDLETGKLLWQKGEEAGFVSDMALIDGVLYTKYGIEVHSQTLAKDEVKVSVFFDEDPFGFKAYDALTGKEHWNLGMENSPGIHNPQFSIYNYYDTEKKRLYFSDDENIYALKLGANGGKFDWKFNYEENGIDEMDYEESFAIATKWIGTVRRITTTTYSTGYGFGYSVTSETGGLDEEKSQEFYEDRESADMASTYTSSNNIYGVTAKRCLRVSFGKEKLLIVGANKICMINQENGDLIWATEWDYSPEATQYVPKVIGGKLLFCADEQLNLLDLSNGKILWTSEESENSKFLLGPNEIGFFSINDEEINGYSLTK